MLLRTLPPSPSLLLLLPPQTNYHNQNNNQPIYQSTNNSTDLNNNSSLIRRGGICIFVDEDDAEIIENKTSQCSQSKGGKIRFANLSRKKSSKQTSAQAQIPMANKCRVCGAELKNLTQFDTNQMTNETKRKRFWHKNRWHHKHRKQRQTGCQCGATGECLHNELFLYISKKQKKQKQLLTKKNNIHLRKSLMIVIQKH